MQPGRRNKTKTVEARRATIARLYLQRHTGQEIAAKVGVSESQVSRDLKIIADRWKQEAVNDLGEKRSQDYQEYLLIRRELWQAWNDSKDTKAIAELLKNLKQTAQLLGYDGADKLELNVTNLSDNQIDQLLTKILSDDTTES